jgi:hypothetical protein
VGRMLVSESEQYRTAVQRGVNDRQTDLAGINLFSHIA